MAFYSSLCKSDDHEAMAHCARCSQVEREDFPVVGGPGQPPPAFLIHQSQGWPGETPRGPTLTPQEHSSFLS